MDSLLDISNKLLKLQSQNQKIVEDALKDMTPEQKEKFQIFQQKCKKAASEMDFSKISNLIKEFDHGS